MLYGNASNSREQAYQLIIWSWDAFLVADALLIVLPQAALLIDHVAHLSYFSALLQSGTLL